MRKFYHVNFSKFIYLLNYFRPKIQNVSEDDYFATICSKFFESSSVDALVVDTIYSLRIQNNCTKLPILMEEIFVTFPVALKLRKNHYLFGIINEVMERIVPSGIPQFLHNFHRWNDFLRIMIDPPQKQTEVLTMNDLGFGFVMWLVACAISTFGFIIEITMWPKIKRLWIEKWEYYNKKIIEKINSNKLIEIN